MKKIICFILLIAMLATNMMAFAEESTDAELQVDQFISTPTVTEEETVYKKYFESAFAIVNYTMNVNVSLNNFFYLRNRSIDLRNADFSFLLDIESPLELTESQMKAMYEYYSLVEENYPSYLSSTMNAAISFSRILPAYFEAFKLLEKPTVPEKYAYVDSCIDTAISEAQKYYEGIVAYLNGNGPEPGGSSYNVEAFE